MHSHKIREFEEMKTPSPLSVIPIDHVKKGNANINRIYKFGGPCPQHLYGDLNLHLEILTIF